MLNKRLTGRPYDFAELGLILAKNTGNYIRSAFYDVFIFVFIHDLIAPLFRFTMGRVLIAETAVLLGFHPVWVVFLFLHSIVVALLAILAGQGNFCTHVYPSF